ncbi:MAG: sulfite exporter TauE/SafE family protein, partial [Phycisphaerae bacterium]|nr:sulfite exporter TauE/SafE family protein [Phycisphaerae bacterium]
RGKWDLRVVGNLLPGAVLGVALGGVALYAIRQAGGDARSQTGNAILAMSIGIIALGFVVLQAIKSLRTEPLAFRPVFWQATSVGAVAGLTSTLAHAAGPIVTMYLLPQKMPKERFVATTVLYYWLGNQIKLVPYFALGLLSTRTLSASVLLLPAVAVGVVLGIYLHRKVGQKQFAGIIYTLLALAGLHLIIKSTATLW